MSVASHLHTLPDLLRSQANRIPDQPFVQYMHHSYTYGEFNAHTDGVAAGLAQLGVKEGDVVAVFLPNCIEFLEVWWAILKAGGVLCPINSSYTRPEAAAVIDHSEAVALVTNLAGVKVLGRARNKRRSLRYVISTDEGGDARLYELESYASRAPAASRGPDDLAAILYTAGTSGKPKGAMLTHRNELANAEMGLEVMPLSADDRVGLLLPLYRGSIQIAACVIPMMLGLEIVMWERFSPSKFWQTVAQLEPTILSAGPTILASVLDAPGAPSGSTSLRHVISGAAPLSVELLDAFQSRFQIGILEGYGLTETACISSLNPHDGVRKPGSIGRPVPGQEMQIVDASGRQVAQGENGEIVVKGSNVTPGYWKDPEATAEAIRDGWLHTGDIGYVDEDGYLFIVGRSKDMIVRGGENIYPREIEDALREHKGILECAVIGVPDPARGEQVLAVVAPKPGVELDPDELAEFAAERIAKYKLPRRFEIRRELPKTPAGDIDKALLRDEFAGRAMSSGT